MDHPAAADSIWLLPFSSEDAASEENGVKIAGGKGANLARLTRAGFSVPEGFIITTYAYRAFVVENGLEEAILEALSGVESLSQEALEGASAKIRALFSEGQLPEGLADDLLAAYNRVGETSRTAVAVRSSATAEDLPEMSFAGQQDTYLNVVGGENLLKAVMDCWGSLWTARAIGYRLRNRVPHQDAAIAVVVQQMVESDVSGVLFTANPLTGNRTETVIDATFGLGEALVSGRVEPDHYVIDTARGQIISKTIGAKAIAVRGQVGGGITEIRSDHTVRQALPDEQILALSALGQRVAETYGFPQDIEWAWAMDQLFLLQARPVTALFPIPHGMPAEPLRVMFSFGAVQGLLDPITPLGQDGIRFLFAAGARMFGFRVTAGTQSTLVSAGERLWIDFTPLIRNSVGRRAARYATGMVEPTIQQALESIWDEPSLQPERKGVRLQTIFRMVRVFGPAAANVLFNLISPRARRRFIVEQGERILEIQQKQSAAIEGNPWIRLAQQADLLENIAKDHLPRMLILFVSGIAAGMVSLNFLHRVAGWLEEQRVKESGKAVRWTDIVLESTRGLQHNPTTEMDLALWEIARSIQSFPAAREAFQSRTASELAALYQSGQMPDRAQATIAAFFERYGGRGLAEIDMGRPRWQEDPTHVMEMLLSYLQIEDSDQAPNAVFNRSAKVGERAVEQLAAGARQLKGGWLKSIWVRFFARRMRELLCIRESPKFFMVRMMALIRQELLKSGSAFVETGDLQKADDLFFLSYGELHRFAKKEPQDWKALIAKRQEAYRREKLRRQVPRLLLSDGRAFYEGMRTAGKDEKMLSGSPVSPGSAEGNVRVVLDPRQAGFLPGEILVCQGTDPSWTPLFLSAAGLVMEVGGMMTHGAVVAREYGIPAIVGVDQVTRRLKTGQRIRMDGSTGQIHLVDD